MSESKRSFWASIPGLVTGLAGLVTGIVGLVTVLIQLDVIGGDDDGGPISAGGATTTVAGQALAPGAGGATTIAGRLLAEPATLRLQPNEKEKAVTVRNGSSAAVTVLKPEYTGVDRTSFSTDGGCTNVSLRPGASCTVKVILTPSGALKTYRASLVLEARELSGVTEVAVEAATIL